MDFTNEIVLPQAEKLVNKVKVIGPSRLGAPYPPFDKYAINESRLPHPMRYKYHELYWDGEGLTLYWITQEEFDEDDAIDFAAEIKRAFNEIRIRSKIAEPFRVLLDVESRNGNSSLKKELHFDDLRESKETNPLKAAHKFAKKRQKGLPALSTLNPDAGDVAKGISMFNSAMGAGTGMGESLEDEEVKTLVADISDAGDVNLGQMTFTDIDGKIKIKADLGYLPKDTILGFHIHETGECEAPYDSAGDHYNPEDVKHPEHSGDMPPLIVNKDGKAYLEFITDRFTLDEIEGKAVIIHSQRDDFKSQPAGDAGERIACGVIKKIKEEA